jgi:hypothetical protein
MADSTVSSRVEHGPVGDAEDTGPYRDVPHDVVLQRRYKEEDEGAEIIDRR